MSAVHFISKRTRLSICVLLFSVFLNGCSSVHFLYQGARGQLRLLNRGRGLDEVVKDPTTDPKLAALLSQVPIIKKFGEQNGLKPTPNYREYVKLDQDAVVYVVTVSDALKLNPKIFSFPIVGSFNYIGWFERDNAEKFAQTYIDAGDDVDLRGASAYSTLGWFKDPLLSTMISMKEGSPTDEALPELVNVVLHESVHATLYINDQSYFNESLAFFLADVLTEKYYREKSRLETPEWKAYLDHQKYFEKVQARMATAYQDLKKIYDSSASLEEKTSRKTEYLKKLQDELKFRRKINNATLIQFQTYDPSDQGFRALYERSGNDVTKFLQTLQRLKKSGFSQKHEPNLKSVLQAL